ncbi:GSCFA domain-containing protein [Kordia sp.]|uniref:GSCFA domain-containing protein n=1 Tax=Kordia sp. TaxID=1965332 RepID=UPI003D284CC0
MILQTNISFKKEPYNPITYDANVCLLGSCFSEHMGKKLSYYKFNTFQNPVGILFHPKAIENLILKAINQDEFTEDDIFYANERWHCFEAHSALSTIDKDVLLSNLNTALKETFKTLHEASHIIITLGTAWTYRYIETDTIVANCHKIPQKKFLKELLSVDDITASVENCVALLKSINPKITTIFTVSPVRHLKDGFIENQRSKAHLLAGIHQVVTARHQIHYFPSYEIMMDELRDYRFYTEDMIHPNVLAIQYIWEKFSHAWISHESETTMKTIENIQKGLAHKPFNPNAQQHQDFLAKLQVKITQLQVRFPKIIF